MDWSKAKTILIIALIITDLFLIFTYGIKKDDDVGSKNEAALISVLESNNIFVETTLPQEHEDMPVLAVEYRDVSEQEIRVLIESVDIKVSSSSAEAFADAAVEFVNYLGMMSEYAETDVIVTDEEKFDATVNFVCKIDDFYLDGSYMACTFEGGEITHFTSHWLEPADFSGRKLETISPSVALLSFMSERDTDGAPSYVTAIEMVYWVNDASYEISEAISDTALPAWRITLSDGEAVYVEAFEREGQTV